jgi:protease I
MGFHLVNWMKKVLILVDDLYEDLELWYPKIRFQENEVSSLVAGPKSSCVYQGKHGYPCLTDLEFWEAEEPDFDGLLIPGGYAPDKLRRYPKVLELVQQFNASKKCIGFICHAGWVPISAKILKGRKVTSVEAIKDDIENAGAHWEDKEVVVDKNLISSRTPKDLAYFAKAMLDYMYKK